MKVRYEDFGSLVALDEPPALVQLDRDATLALGLPPSPRWQRPRGHFSAPTEAHVLLTERCGLGCPGCYVDATERGPALDADKLREVFDALADAGVFHVALGGGESTLRDDLFELAAYARSRGLVPSLTTSGVALGPDDAARYRVFGQVNVSLDGVGDVYRSARGYDGAPRALRALGHLAEAGVPCGVNLVVDRHTLPHVVSTVAAAARAGAREIEVLRYKPAGRARSDYEARAMTAAQRAGFAAVAFALADRFAELDIKLDCSLVPFLVATDPDPAIVQRFGVMGCEAGNMLAAVRGDGRPTACSFIERAAGTDAQALFGEAWDTSPELQRWRGFVNAAPEPCASCPWAAVCRGGCKVVSEHLTGERFAPDPECPRVEASAAGRPSVPVSSALADHPRLLAASPGGTT